MMKRLPNLIASLLVMMLAQSPALAQIPNADFENWTPSGNPPPFDWMEPTGWKCNNPLTEVISAGIRPSMTPYAGTYACEVHTTNLFGTYKPGLVVSGNAVLDTANSSVKVITGGNPISTRPVKLTGYYKFPVTVAGDTAQIVCILKKFNATLHKEDTIGMGKVYLTPTASYTAFSDSIYYTSSAMPDSIIVAIYSTLPERPKPTSTSGAYNALTVDKLALVNPSTADINDIAAQLTGTLYPNPVIDHFSINLSGAASDGQLQLTVFDMTGKQIIRNQFTKLQVNDFKIDAPAGIYQYRIEETGTGASTSGKFCIVKE